VGEAADLTENKRVAASAKIAPRADLDARKTGEIDARHAVTRINGPGCRHRHLVPR
jgi:hypothetical protein